MTFMGCVLKVNTWEKLVIWEVEFIVVSHFKRIAPHLSQIFHFVKLSTEGQPYTETEIVNYISAVEKSVQRRNTIYTMTPAQKVIEESIPVLICVACSYMTLQQHTVII